VLRQRERAARPPRLEHHPHDRSQAYRTASMKGRRWQWLAMK
jgi:hypothetical protein